MSFFLFLLFAVSLAAGAGIAAAGFAWLAMLAATIVVFWSPEVSVRIRGLVLASITFASETGLDLGSFGRLNLAVLALSLAVIASLRLDSWAPKVVTMVLTGPILSFLISQRVSFLQTERGVGVVSETEGFGSVVGPFHSAGAIVEAYVQGRISMAWGESIFNAAVTGIPRAIWPDKPVGLGREIVEVTQPWLVSSAGFSDAGTFVGEAVWNFGVWLAPLYLALFILLIRMMDKQLGKYFERLPHFFSFVVLMTLAML